jgi:hypothetical protein
MRQQHLFDHQDKCRHPAFRTPHGDSRLWDVRFWDMYNGWVTIYRDCTTEVALFHWKNHTNNGTMNTKYSDGDYWAIYASDARTVTAPESSGK